MFRDGKKGSGAEFGLAGIHEVWRKHRVAHNGINREYETFDSALTATEDGLDQFYSALPIRVAEVPEELRDAYYKAKTAVEGLRSALGKYQNPSSL